MSETDMTNRQLLAIILSTGILSAGGSSALQMAVPARHDAFTATMHRDAVAAQGGRDDIQDEDIHKIEQSISDIHGSITTLRDIVAKKPPQDLLDRVTRGEVGQEHIKQNLVKIEANQDKMMGVLSRLERVAYRPSGQQRPMFMEAQ